MENEHESVGFCDQSTLWSVAFDFHSHVGSDIEKNAPVLIKEVFYVYILYDGLVRKKKEKKKKKKKKKNETLLLKQNNIYIGCHFQIETKVVRGRLTHTSLGCFVHRK